MPESGRETALYIVLDADATAPQRARAALACRLVQSVLIRPPAGAKLDPVAIKSLIEIIQAKGVAALIEQDARLARTLRADGVHLRWSETVADDLAQARAILGTRGIVGAEAGASRHDAMLLAEGGADYVAFAVMPAADMPAARQARLDLVDWWAPIFEVPCVAFDTLDAAEAGVMTEMGADFIGVTLAGGETLAQSAERVEACAAAVEHAVSAADSSLAARR